MQKHEKFNEPYARYSMFNENYRMFLREIEEQLHQWPLIWALHLWGGCFSYFWEVRMSQILKFQMRLEPLLLWGGMQHCQEQRRDKKYRPPPVLQFSCLFLVPPVGKSWLRAIQPRWDTVLAQHLKQNLGAVLRLQDDSIITSSQPAFAQHSAHLLHLFGLPDSNRNSFIHINTAHSLHKKGRHKVPIVIISISG